jgi:hypothetical protein
MMEHEDDQIDLSLRERCQVVGIGTGCLLVLGFLAWLAITYAAPVTILDGIPESFRTGRIRSALGLCSALVFYVVGLPVGLMLSLLSIFQAVSGRKTRLTRWILRGLSQQEVRRRHERALKSLDAEGELSRTDKILHS